jgi:hypothetical protein
VVAALVGSGLSARIGVRVKSRRATKHASGDVDRTNIDEPAEADTPAASGGFPGVEKLPPRLLLIIGVLAVEPAGIEPATSCLQSRPSRLRSTARGLRFPMFRLLWAKGSRVLLPFPAAWCLQDACRLSRAYAVSTIPEFPSWDHGIPRGGAARCRPHRGTIQQPPRSLAATREAWTLTMRAGPSCILSSCWNGREMVGPCLDGFGIRGQTVQRAGDQSRRRDYGRPRIGRRRALEQCNTLRASTGQEEFPIPVFIAP